MTEATQTPEPIQPATEEAQAPQGAQTESLLSQAGAQEWAPPEKYVVKNEAGELDFKQMAQKIDQARSHLEKRLGSGDLPPKAPEEYEATVEGLDFAEYKKNPEAQKFLKGAHAKGLTNGQIEYVLSEYVRTEQSKAIGSEIMTVEKAAESLKQVWKDQTEFDGNIKSAWKATNAIATQLGMSMQDIDDSGLGNNPTFLRMMAHMKDQFAEDTPVNPAGDMPQEDIESEMMSEAYRNPKHPDHKKVSARVKSYFDAKYKD